MSLARTVRRPGYDLLAPYLAFEEPADEDALQGNPLLKNEKAWGVDVGYERRIGARGVFGVNLFYRDIENLIDITNTGVSGQSATRFFMSSMPLLVRSAISEMTMEGLSFAIWSSASGALSADPQMKRSDSRAMSAERPA